MSTPCHLRTVMMDDTTQGATYRNGGQPQAKEIGLSKLFLQHPATPINRLRRIVAPKGTGPCDWT
jgi:hypothetical protein